MDTLSPDAKHGCEQKTTERERQLRAEVKDWEGRTYTLEQQSIKLMPRLAASHLAVRNTIIWIMAIVLVAALLCITAPYYAAYKPAVYTVETGFVMAPILVMIALAWSAVQDCMNSKSPKCRHISSSSQVEAAAASLICDLRQVASVNKSCDGLLCQVSLTVRLLAQRAKVWEAHNQAVYKQQEHNDLVKNIVESEVRTSTMQTATCYGLFFAAAFIEAIRSSPSALTFSGALAFQFVPVVVLLVWIILFKAGLKECRRLLDESKSLLAEVADAKGCIDKLV